VIIAVDGPAASGKGTLARRIARHYGLSYLDTGRTYRAVAAAMRTAGDAWDDEAAAVRTAWHIDFSRLDDPALSAPEAGEGASRIAVLPQLREVLVARQRVFAHHAEEQGGGAVLDGRDIGTVVCPEARVKLFITASVEERARRRALELFGEAEGDAYDTVLATLQRRDARDSGRAASPMRPAADAHVIDTTRMDPDAAFSAARRLVDTALSD
jgi:cytidylate kinase